MAAVDETTLRNELRAAMKAKDALRTGVIREILAALKNKAIENKSTNLDEREVLAVIKREAKQTAETLDYARKAGRDATVAETSARLEVIKSFLPVQLDKEQLGTIIRGLIDEQQIGSVGPLMKELAERHPGAYDGKLASGIAAAILKER
ncbi:MAG: GatB/YqeY domain-containing protein [Candidatus Binatia bacterium]